MPILELLVNFKNMLTHVEFTQFTFVSNQPLIVTREALHLKDKSKTSYLKTRIRNNIVQKYEILFLIKYLSIYLVILIIEIDKNNNIKNLNNKIR